MHHVRKLEDLSKKGKREQPLWMKVMITRRRKVFRFAKRVMRIFITIGQSQRKKETGEPDDAISITSGSEGG